MNRTMPESTRMDNRTLLRRTLVTVGAMVGACVLVVGTLTLVVSVLVGRAVDPRDASDGGAAVTPMPATGPRFPPAGSRAIVNGTTPPGK